jgi:hypothetical protein
MPFWGHEALQGWLFVVSFAPRYIAANPAGGEQPKPAEQQHSYQAQANLKRFLDVFVVHLTSRVKRASQDPVLFGVLALQLDAHAGARPVGA